VYKIFKLIILYTNKKNLELNLLKQVNTLQTLRYLANGGIYDLIENTTPKSIFKDLIIEPRLRHLLSGWCIDNNNLSIHALQELDQGNYFKFNKNFKTLFIIILMLIYVLIKIY
jgi:hypothetical protein